MQAYDIHIDENKQETTKHGTPDFPLAVYTTQISKNVLGFIDWHWHDELQFCYVNEGKVRFQVNDETFVLDDGEGIFINKGQLHKATNWPGYDSTYTCIDFHEDLISSFIGSRINDKYINRYTNSLKIESLIFQPSISWQQTILDRLKAVATQYYQEQFGYELEIMILLLEVWKNMVDHYFKDLDLETIHHDEENSVKQILNYIHHHYHEKIELDELAREVNLSKSSLSRKFKAKMDCTIFEYILNYRLTCAAKLLLSSGESVAEIAYQCGFSSSSYFIEKFKNKSGLSPHKYRHDK